MEINLLFREMCIYLMKKHETQYGASTSALVIFSKDEFGMADKVILTVDTSSHETNFMWDGWPDLTVLNGKTKGEVDEWIEDMNEYLKSEYSFPVQVWIDIKKIFLSDVDTHLKYKVIEALRDACQAELNQRDGYKPKIIRR